MVQDQAGHKFLRLGRRYIPQRLDTACRRVLDVDLIDIRRLERILVQALEQEALPNCLRPCQSAVLPVPAVCSPIPQEVSHEPGH